MRMKTESYLDETVYSVHPEDYRALCEKLYKEGFDFPRCLSGADMEYGLRVALHLQDSISKKKATVRTEIPYDKPNLPSVTDIWGGVEWHEREAFDLVGVIFEHHPDLRRILTEDDWSIHPLQKRYDTKGYLMSEWQAKPWPEISIWEEVKPAEPTTAQNEQTTTTAQATETTNTPTETGERVKKPPKRWEPKEKKNEEG